ncbi:MAG: peptidylprolyl isomerase [Bacteroidales bacterium]|nr:peptidylprolyl isomerase [Bacteroidales bacterium]
MIKFPRRLFPALVLIFTAVPAFAQKYSDGMVDKSIAVVGKDVIMLSEIEEECRMQRMRGLIPDMTTRCEILEAIMVNKLFYFQAQLDSLTVNDANVEAMLDARVDEAYSSLGGEAKVEEYFGKPIYKIRAEWREALSEQSLIQEMQRNVTGKAPRLTPSEVEEYYKSLPEEDLPMVSTKYRMRQIGLYPDRESANLAVKEKLLELRERVVNGEKFSTLARLYSQDPGSMTKGGELGMMSKNVFWPEFSDAAMSLKVGQVSQIVETPDGFHIIQLIDRQGDMFNARHILMKPVYTSEDRTKAFNRLDSIRNLIVADSISFQDAARKFSEDPKTSTSGGLLSDPYTGSSYFEKDQLKPTDYAVLKSMQEGETSEPFESLDNEGRNGNTIYKIIYLEKIIPSHTATYKDDYNDLLTELENKNAAEAIDKFIREKQKVTKVKIDPLFQGCEFKYDGWLH